MFRQTLTMLCGVSLISAAGCVHHPDLNAPQEELTQYVRPLVGTAGFGNTYPGSQIPFGGIQMSPDTDFDDYDVAAGYKYDHPTLLGFSLTHLSGTGIPDLGDFLFMPGVGEIRFDPETKYMRGRDINGGWRTPFAPIAYQGPGSVNGWGDITEGFTLQYTWYVPHDVQGYINEAGRDLFEARLDSLFVIEMDENIPGAHDIWGRIGGYWHGNEPCHQIIYLYNYLNRPWDCQRWIRYVIDHFYGNEPGSLSGNDDCGQMSAWYIFNCMGFYPTAPSSNIYNIGSPALEAVTMRLGNGHQVKVTTENWSKQNVYVEKMLLNGKEYDKSYITYDDIRDGADIHFVMSGQPNRQRAVSDRSMPPSLSKTGETLRYRNK